MYSITCGIQTNLNARIDIYRGGSMENDGYKLNEHSSQHRIGSSEKGFRSTDQFH